MAAVPPPHATASKLAQLLGETIVHHAPWTAGVNEQAKWEATNRWLDGLEQHTAKQVGPFLKLMLERSDPPAEIRHLIEEAIEPGAAFSSVIEQVFLWGIVMNLISTSVVPFTQGIANDLNSAAVGAGIHRPVDPATIATAAARGLNLGDPATFPMPQWAYDQAAMSGISSEDLDLMGSIIGLPPALQELFELYRRGIIRLDEVKKGLREGDFRDDWVDTIVNLAHVWLTPLDFVRAAVQSQLPYETAKEWAKKTGLDVETDVPVEQGGGDQTPDMFGLAYAISGRPPGPVELGNMALRGIIPWEGLGAGETTFEQGVHESDVKTKWTGALKALMTYVPPPETIGSLFERGGITIEQAQALWEQRGVPAPLTKALTYVAEQQHVGQDKLLARGDITTAYFDGILPRAQAVEMLGLLGYRDQVADEILAITDFRRQIKAINSVVNRIGNLFVAYKVTNTVAKDALVHVGIPAEEAQGLIATWDSLRVEPIRVPNAREIGRAVKYGTLTTDQALAEMERLGYQPRDAAIVVSTYAETAITPLPAAGTTITGSPGLPPADVGPGGVPLAPGQGIQTGS